MKITKIPIKIQLLHKDAQIPSYQTEYSSGLDLMACEEKVLMPGEIKLINIGFAIELKPGYEAQVRPRSGLSLKSIIAIFGTIDGDYRGEIKVILANFSQNEFKVQVGMRIAQMIIGKIEQVEFLKAEVLEKTERGSGGFGSTGL